MPVTGWVCWCGGQSQLTPQPGAGLGWGHGGVELLLHPALGRQSDFALLNYPNLIAELSAWG